MAYQVDFFPVGEGSKSGDAIAIRMCSLTPSKGRLSPLRRCGGCRCSIRLIRNTTLRTLRFLADQVSKPQHQNLRRFDQKPKRLASRRLFLLQSLPGVGPELAHRLLGHFGSIEQVLSADVPALAQVRGISEKKAARIRELVR